jgi:FAD/FMN-containing dehydrogenase
MLPTPTHSLIEQLEALRKRPETRLLEAHLSVDADHFLTEALIFHYAESPSLPRSKDDLDGENNTWLRKVIFQASRTGNLGKVVRWELEKLLSPLVEQKTLSRNTAMAVPVHFLQNPDPHSTDILQEYFVPTEQAYSFLESYKKLLNKYQINLLNVTVRKVKQDTNALVSYTRQDMYGFVVYYKVEQNKSDVQALMAFTREMVEYLLSIKATYYLCYGSYYTPSQLTRMYPQIRTLFALKTHYDPAGLFSSVWYEKYRDSLSQPMARS